jgi:hypothetical protein
VVELQVGSCHVYDQQPSPLTAEHAASHAATDDTLARATDTESDVR